MVAHRHAIRTPAWLPTDMHSDTNAAVQPPLQALAFPRGALVRRKGGQIPAEGRVAASKGEAGGQSSAGPWMMRAHVVTTCEDAGARVSPSRSVDAQHAERTE
ncbi:hypothetical protein DCS_02018 [Drechmeria coniospora]|uniref:Uncharacterized protein n=1 Tax=Drechmeria coniospora TaxID=98403 RepID=A0A151GUY8_DRECN|nr:hypothetical protein DCS_02018 [Drechmeria coniospora]KYK60880.1 hypothetical protein DCS_02018 [Drechmeria coniospora]